MNNKPLISFCIPVHNAAPYLAETVHALLAQEDVNLELVCVDDHSTDNSAELLQSFGNQLRWMPARGRGAAAARNQAFAESRGTYIVFFDADDLVSANHLRTQLQQLTAHPGAVVVSKWGRFFTGIHTDFTEDGQIIKEDLSFREWVLRYWSHNRHTTPPGRVLIPRALLGGSGLWNEALSLNDDLEFFTRVFAAATQIRYNDQGCFYYRSGIGGLSSKTTGYDRQLSNFKAIDGATRHALAYFPSDAQVRRACANMWQNFIYENYPANRELVRQAKVRIRAAGGADFAFPAGGLTRMLVKGVGWKATKRIKALARL